MFQELMPLLAQRILLLTLSRVSDEQLCVNVIPKPLKSDQRDGDAALTTPLSVTGAPKELDEQLPRQLVEFVDSLGAVLDLEECERTDGGCRQSIKRSRQEANEFEIADRLQQEYDSKRGESADRIRQRKLK
jgi:PRTRC genetic system protein E